MGDTGVIRAERAHRDHLANPLILQIGELRPREVNNDLTPLASMRLPCDDAQGLQFTDKVMGSKY